jgi:hypothetical protein
LVSFRLLFLCIADQHLKRGSGVRRGRKIGGLFLSKDSISFLLPTYITEREEEEEFPDRIARH